MAMDRAEILGFGAAVGGHALLLGLFALGLMASAQTAPKPQSISVSLVGEIADVSSAPDAIQEESAPPASGETAPTEPPPAPTPVMKIEKPQTKPVPKPVKAETAPAVAKATAKPIKTAAATPPKTTKATPASGKGTTPAKPGGLSRSFEDSINNIGKAPGAGKAAGTPAARTAAVIRSAVNNTISAEVRPLIPPCTPRTSDNSSLKVFVALNIGRSGNLLDANVYKLVGETPSNAAQIPQVKQCVLNSLRAASPYNLNPDEFDTWKYHKVQIEVNFR